MPRPPGASLTTTLQHRTTALGYQTFPWGAWRRRCNECTGTPFNFLACPTDIVLLVVLGRLLYQLSLRYLAEMFPKHGFVFTHETVRDWEERFTPVLTQRLRTKRRGQAGRSWCVDETSIKVRGRWCYLSRAIERDGHLVDSLRRERRDQKAAQRFFRGARAVGGQVPDRGTTDGHAASRRAIRRVVHRRTRNLSNRLEQDHRGIKQRSYPMRGFGSFEAAARFCTAHDELRDSFRSRQRMGETVPRAPRRPMIRDRWAALRALLAVSSPSSASQHLSTFGNRSGVVVCVLSPDASQRGALDRAAARLPSPQPDRPPGAPPPHCPRPSGCRAGQSRLVDRRLAA